MSVEENFYKKNNDLQHRVLAEISKVKEGQSKKNILQLETILNELRNIERKKDFLLSYPRIIIDSWDYSDQLGIELIELAELYRRIKTE